MDGWLRVADGFQATASKLRLLPLSFHSGDFAFILPFTLSCLLAKFSKVEKLKLKFTTTKSDQNKYKTMYNSVKLDN